MRQKVVLPIRYVSLGEAVQSTTRELSEEGVGVRCVEPPGPGAELMLQLQLPGGDPAVIGAEVDEVSIDPKESGFWARFLEPDPVFLARVRAALRGVQHKAAGIQHRASTLEAAAQAAAAASPAPLAAEPGEGPGMGRSRRTGQRYLDRLVVKLGGRGYEPGVFALDVSSTGLFVLMPKPPELDAVLQLTLELPDKKGPVQVLGVVARRLTPEEAAKKNTQPGAGLVFMGGNDEFRTRYDAYLKALGKK